MIDFGLHSYHLKFLQNCSIKENACIFFSFLFLQFILVDKKKAGMKHNIRSSKHWGNNTQPSAFKELYHIFNISLYIWFNILTVWVTLLGLFIGIKTMEKKENYCTFDRKKYFMIITSCSMVQRRLATQIGVEELLTEKDQSQIIEFLHKCFEDFYVAPFGPEVNFIIFFIGFR